MATQLSFAAKEKGSNLEKVLKGLLVLPLWVKQYVYLRLREDLSQKVDIQKLENKSISDLVQMYIPTPTAAGQRYINRRLSGINAPKNLPQNQSKLLKSLGQGKSIIDICHDNQWSLLKCSQILVECIELQLVELIENTNIANTVYYLAGKIRLGEYLLRMNKLSLQQIDKALYTQKEIDQTIGERTKIGDLLVNLGFIKESDKNDILCLKECSNQEFTLEDETETIKKRITDLERELEIVKFENEGLKQDLTIYHDEVLNKTKQITELQEIVEKQNEKGSFWKKLIPFKIVANNA